MANKSRVYAVGGSSSAPAAPPWFDVADRVSADAVLPGGIPPVVTNGALMPIPVGISQIFPMLIYTFGLTTGGSANQVVQWLVVERDGTGLLNIYSMGGDGSPGDLGTAAPIAEGADNVRGRVVSGTANPGVARQVIMLGPPLTVPAPPPP